jgi:hypothetical protein
LIASAYGLLGGAFYSAVAGGLYLLIQKGRKVPGAKKVPFTDTGVD